MLYIIIYVAVLIVFIIVPLPVQIVLFIINLFFPDPLPVIDEAAMAASMLKKLSKLERVMEFKEDHPVIFWILMSLAIAGIVGAIVYVVLKW